MAYLDLRTAYPDPAPVGGRQADLPAAPSAFSALEWSVIALARRDGLRSLGTPGPVARAMGGLFGLGSSSRLADPRLESLRRAAVYAWRRGFAIPRAEIGRFLEAGFSEGQLERMVESITGWRVERRTAHAA